MSYIICIIGKSRSGKDTLAKHFQGKHLKFAGPAKKLLEQWYGLPDGGMEDPEWRNKAIPGNPERTYLDVLVEMYQFWLRVDPLAPKYNVLAEIEKTLGEGTPVVLTDVRMPQELDAIAIMGYPVYAIRVNRPGCPEVSSDQHLEFNWNTLTTDSADCFEFNNVGSLEDLEIFAEETEAYISDHASFTKEYCQAA